MQYAHKTTPTLAPGSRTTHKANAAGTLSPTPKTANAHKAVQLLLSRSLRYVRSVRAVATRPPNPQTTPARSALCSLHSLRYSLHHSTCTASPAHPQRPPNPANALHKAPALAQGRQVALRRCCSASLASAWLLPVSKTDHICPATCHPIAPSHILTGRRARTGTKGVP